MKRNASIKTVFAVVAISLSVASVKSEDFIVDGIYYNILSPTEVEVTGGQGEVYSGYVVIPEKTTYNDTEYTVTAIGDWAMSGCYLVDSVKLPETINVIKEWAFTKCEAMQKINLPSAITSIGDAAFAGCEGLTELQLPSKLQSIGERAFSESGLHHLILPNSLASIGDMAFSGCPNMTYFTVYADNQSFSTPDGTLLSKDGTVLLAYPNAKNSVYTTYPTVTTIGDHAFAGCENLTEIVLDNNVTTVGLEAFANCESLHTVQLGDNTLTFKERPFYRCTAIRNFVVSDNNANFSSEDGILFNKDKTTLIRFPNAHSSLYVAPQTVTSIASEAFASCADLEEVGLSRVEEIGYAAFELCSGLRIVSFDAGHLSKIGARAFKDCTSLVGITLPNTLVEVGEDAFNNCYEIVSLCLPETTESVGERCFYGNTRLVEFTIGAGVESIGSQAFYGCSQLQKLYCNVAQPIAIDADVFEYVDKTNCQLIVPNESVELYRQADVWCDFLSIHDGGINNVDTSAVTVTARDGVIRLSGWTGTVNLYNLSGALIQSTTATTISAPRGAYLLQADKVYKIVL
ncbi:MAG: leucine-rich repeat domain-containing protein [Bacteroidales bacterium]|nr:leucine-rich repeat domain-containing protein [Bacteroidales bacterium]